MNLLGNLLDSETILLSEDGYCRDWRGLKDLVSSKNPDNAGFAGIQSQKNKTGTIIRIWSRSDNAVIRQLLEALECIRRVDVRRFPQKCNIWYCNYSCRSYTAYRNTSSVILEN